MVNVKEVEDMNFLCPHCLRGWTEWKELVYDVGSNRESRNAIGKHQSKRLVGGVCEQARRPCLATLNPRDENSSGAFRRETEKVTAH